MKQIKFKLKQDFSLTNIRSFISKDELRPIMSRVFLDVKNSCLVATNNFILVKYQIEVLENSTGLESVNISHTLFNKNAYRNDKGDKQMDSFTFTLSIDSQNNQLIEVFNSIEQSVYLERNKPMDSNYPNYKAVLTNKMHKIVNGELFPIDGFKKDTHLLNPVLLKQCMNAIKLNSYYSVVIDNQVQFEGKTHPCLITYYNSDNEEVCQVLIMSKSSL